MSNSKVNLKDFDSEVIPEKVNMKSKIKNFDIVQTRNGNIYLVCVDEGILINIGTVGYLFLSEFNDDLTHNDNEWGIDEWDIMEIYRGINNYSLKYMIDFKNQKGGFTRVWKRPEVKV